MKSNRFIFALVITVTFAIVGAGLSLIFSKFIDFSSTRGIETIPQKSIAAKQTGGTVVFNPPLPQDAPTSIKDAVMLGYNIMTDTRKYAAGYVGNKLDCDNCHFKGGITEGGRNGGLSLAGVATKYPEYRKQAKGISDLLSRTNSCFEKSMNGKPLPLDSKEMIALVTYYQWISKCLPIYADIPWLGVQHLKSAYKPDAAKRNQVFAQKCAMCHGDNGQGTLAAPPLWGKDSFNDGAGMTKLDNFSAFAHFNMPLGNPDLSIENALDVAAFVTTRPKPHFTEKNKQGG
jgi:thiosulfate dehydrogenase